MGSEFWLPGAQATVPAYVTPDKEWSPWDKVSLNGEVLPGICKLKVAPIPLRFDEKKQPGFSGSPFTPKGLTQATMDLEIHFLTEEDWISVQNWIALLWTKPTKQWAGAGSAVKLKQITPKDAQDIVPVWDISHPKLTGSGIDKVVVVGYTPPEEDGSPQKQVVKFKLKQWTKAPVKAPSKPKPAPEQGVAPPLANRDQTTPANQAGPPPSKTDTKRR